VTVNGALVLTWCSPSLGALILKTFAPAPLKVCTIV
jgi:hypothetical protein